jgi:putative GTP pyrophosphokinase
MPEPARSTDHHIRFAQERPRIERFTASVQSTLESLISQNGVEYLSVTSRVKDVESFTEKIARKGYADPFTQMTDHAGLRVVAYIETDADSICRLINAAFHVHSEKSLDKKDELSKDRFGYRSVHFICDLGPARLALPEYSGFSDLVFEVQVRTSLQHAWAEIHHDRGYKFAGTLPHELERHLYRQAAILEGVDREFARLAPDLDQYTREVAARCSHR